MQSQGKDMHPSDTSAPARSAAAPWVDIALRALDTSVATSQTLIEGADRLARASAASDLPPHAMAQPVTPAMWSGAKAALDCGQALARAMQRSAVSLVMQGWQGWASAIRQMTSIAGPADVERTTAPARHAPADHASTGARAGWERADAANSARGWREHATASAGSKQHGGRKRRPAARAATAHRPK